MKTKNIYSYPIDKENIIKIITKEAPAHKIWHSDKGVYDLTNAIDFLCNEGTPIKSALDGEVIDIVNNIKENYNKKEPPSKKIMPEEKQDGNYIVIKHKNNEFSQYSHFGYKKIVTKKGKKIKEGELIGYSGNTGWSIKAHLHFLVFKFIKLGGKSFKSLNVSWRKT